MKIKENSIDQPVKKFDLNLYKKEFNSSLLFWCCGLLGFFILFSEPIDVLLNTVFVQTVLKFCPQNSYWVDFVIFAFFIFSLYFIVKKWYEDLIMSISSVLLLFCFYFVYILFFRVGSYFEFYFFHLSALSGLAYWDFLVISFLIVLSTYKPYRQPLKVAASKYSFISDDPSLENYLDGYSRAGYAKEITNHINQTTTKSSFAIGIVGEWGAGKTDFLLRLKKELKENYDNRVVDFNPWRVNKPDAIIEEFFNTLSLEIRPFNQSINSKIKDYSKRILQTGKEIQYRLFDTLISEWVGNETIEEQYSAINTAISNTAKRWIIVIDDVDRLTGKEIMEVLRIIRNTANFGNTFFIIAIDQKYIVSALKNAKEFANEEEYLKKIFQLTITLPAFKKEIFIPQVKSFLITDDLSDEDKQSVSSALSKLTTDYGDVSVPFFPAADHDDILEKLIDNVRDLKRFVNSFKIAFNLLKGEVDIHDLMVLELIRNRNLEVYNLIKTRALLGFNNDKTSEFILNEGVWNAFIDKNKESLVAEEAERLRDSILYLVTDIGYKNGRKFLSSNNFYLYFSYQLFNLISLKEFNILFEKDSSKITEKFEQWSNEGKQPELLRIIAQLTDFQDSDFLLKIIIAYLNIKTDHHLWLEQVTKLLFVLSNYNHEKYFKSDLRTHKKFLKNLMNNDSITPMDRVGIATLFLQDYNRSKVNRKLVLTKVEWLRIIKQLFDKHLNEIKVLSSDTMYFLYQNVEQIDSKDKIILYKPAVASFKKALLANSDFFEKYISMIFRPAYSPYSGNEPIVFEPFLEQIFGDWKKFTNILKGYSFNDAGLKKIKKIILENIQEFYVNNKRPFRIKDIKESKFVDSWMVKQKTATIRN